MNRILVLLSVLLMLAITQLYAQNPTRISIKGIVQDTNSAVLADATVMLLSPSDSSLVNFGNANEKGGFEFRNVKNIPYLLKISYVGFLPYQQHLTPSPTAINDLGFIKIKPISQELLEIVVKTAKAPLSIKGDTIEYNAASFKVPPGSTVEDLLRKLPGIEVDGSGNIKAQGNDVKKVTVDGKTFFGDDPKAATKNLGAETISKIQVFNRKSDQATITGVDDGSKEKTINLELKENFKKGEFGKITGAVGTSDRGVLRGNYNRFNKKEQFSVIGYANNINETGVNWSDYGEFKGNNTFSSFDNGDFGFGSGGDAFFIGGDDDLLSSFNGKGFTNNLGGGVNYNYTHDKTKLSTSYVYNQTKLNLDQNQNKRTFLQNGSFSTLDTSSTVSFRANHSISGRWEQMLDSTNTLITKANLRFSNSNSAVGTRQEYINNNDALQNRINLNNSSNLNAYNLNGTAIFRHKFKKVGRVFAASSSFVRSTTDGTDNIRSLTQFFEASNPNDQIRAIAQLNQNANRTLTLKAGLNYLEPLSKRFFWENFYNFSNNQQNVGRDAYNGLIETQRYDSLSTYYENRITYNRIGTGLRFNKKGINLSLGVAALRYDLSGKVYPTEGGNLTTQISKQYDAIVPNFTATFNPQQSTYIRFGYGINVNAPSISALQPVIQNTNPFYITEGNQNLNPTKSHDVNLSISRFNQSNFTSINLWMNYNYYLNQVVYNQTVDANLVTRTRPENMSGAESFRTNLYSSFPIIKTKWTTNLSVNYNLSNTPTLVNSVLNTTNSNAYSANIGFSITPSDKIFVTLGGNYSINNIKYSIETRQNQNIISKGLNIDAKWSFIKKTFLESSFNYTGYENDRFNFSQNIPILNISVRRLLMKDNRLEARLAAFDVFNKRQAITQTGSQNFVTYQQAFTLARYFMLSLTYNVRGHDAKLKKNGNMF
ncbi:TonB-dependent receptor [Flectobacillus sp. DC10W]|uniref:TonB-dependent receptor n=1 Tax=Flectobacillus longus TaxID=2984207 RepID=A0ABT6YT67_9BACT|nr:TonB-dependent receptor [Flectobacillus longus]MDI9866794.1 TonB-dependent receptor [Flectobacillus longus]